MLVTFSCPAYADITLFGDIAVRLLKMMGHSGTVPSALLADEIHDHRVTLEAAIKAEAESTATTRAEQRGEDEEPAVSLSHRALPLIELLKAAERDKCDVIWHSGT
ncbi:MAG: DUF1840 domain-containing protein [Sedimenticola sp.]|nr:DUF1840 domain-containing protein [Sedimenticola sp.]